MTDYGTAIQKSAPEYRAHSRNYWISVLFPELLEYWHTRATPYFVAAFMLVVCGYAVRELT